MKLMVMIAFAYHAFYTEQERVKMGKIVKIVTPIILLVLKYPVLKFAIIYYYYTNFTARFCPIASLKVYEYDNKGCFTAPIAAGGK